jgi:hypothetical protein
VRVHKFLQLEVSDSAAELNTQDLWHLVVCEDEVERVRRLKDKFEGVLSIEGFGDSLEVKLVEKALQNDQVEGLIINDENMRISSCLRDSWLDFLTLEHYLIG